MKKNRLIAAIVIFMFICIAIFLPSISDIYTTTSKEIKDNLFKQKYLYKNKLLDLNNGYIYTFEKRDGSIKNIYTNEQSFFEYKIQDDMLAIKDSADKGYDVYDIKLYEDRISVDIDQKEKIELLFKDKQSESFDEFLFLESTNNKFYSNINAEDIAFYNGAAIITNENSVTKFEYSIDENILTLKDGQYDYYYISVDKKATKIYDESLLGLYLSHDIKNKLELSEGYGYIEIDSKSCEFSYGIVGNYIVCESDDAKKFIIDCSLNSDILEMKILPYANEKGAIYTLTKVS